MSDYYDKVILKVLAAHPVIQFGFYLNRIDEEHYAECQHIENYKNIKVKK